jgi:hypothetical protein
VLAAAGILDGVDATTHWLLLTLAAQIAGDEYAQAIQLGIEYDPQPPFEGGSVTKAPAAIAARVRGASETFA